MVIVGIAGGSGAGKTTLVEHLAASFSDGEVSVISQDSYYRDNSHIPPAERDLINFDHPDSVDFGLLVQHLQMIKNGEGIQMPVYSFLSCTRTSRKISVKPAQILILEGILIFTNVQVRNLMDIRVFVDTGIQERMQRVVDRDVAERGRTSDHAKRRFMDAVQPMHELFVEPSRQYAEIVLPGNLSPGDMAELLKERIRLIWRDIY